MTPLMLHPGHFGRDWSSSSLFQLMLPLSQRERGTGIGHCVIFNYVSPPTRWTGLCGTPTIAPYCPRQQPVLTCWSPRLGMAARLRFQGLSLPAPCLARFQGPRVQFIDLEVVGLLTSYHRTIAVYCHAGRSSLTLWGTFRAARAVPGRDVLVAAALAFLAHESRELVRDVSHHGRTSAGRVHYCSVSS
jgi:hypothetical protein